MFADDVKIQRAIENKSSWNELQMAIPTLYK